MSRLSGFGPDAVTETLAETPTEDDTHPLVDVLKFYCKESQSDRDANEDLSNLDFHRKFGLHLHVPSSWPMLPSVVNLLMSVGGRDNVVIIYPSTAVYTSMSDSINDCAVHMCSVNYFAWHELYVAMDRVNSDASGMMKFKMLLNNADLVVFLGAPSTICEILDQVRCFCDGCLILLS